MTQWFTSDLHVGHNNIIHYCNRPFENVTKMDAELIKRWNAKVGPHDTTYVLGDVSFHSTDRTASILGQLNGKKVLIWGNHDKVIRKSPELIDMFESCHEVLELTVQVNGTKQHVVMCHFPMIVWNKSHHGSWMLHGHSHRSLEYPFKGGKILDVGVDVNNYEPWSLQDIARYMKHRPQHSLDHHGD